MVIEVKAFVKNVVEVAVIDVHVVAQFVPVEARGLGGHESTHDDGDDKKHSSGTDAADGHAFALGLLVLDELDDAPEYEQSRPVVSEQSAQANPGEHVQVPQEENDAENNQHQ